MSYEQTLVIGKILKPPEMRFTGSQGTPVTNFVVVVEKGYEKDGAQKTFQKRWNVTAWNRLAETCAGYSENDLVLLIGEATATGYLNRQGTGEIHGSLGLTVYTARNLGAGTVSARDIAEVSADAMVKTYTKEEDVPF